jgi:hypothetical protein
LTVGWNLRWSQNDLRSFRQLWIYLHDAPNWEDDAPLRGPFGDSRFYVRQNKEVAPDFMVTDYSYPGQRLQGAFDVGAGGGLMIPYDAAMTLSLGETQATRLGNYIYSSKTSYPREYYPFWRLNTSLDNFRLYIGPSDPTSTFSNIDSNYLNYFYPNGRIYGTSKPEGPEKNIYTAMRYHVTNASYGNGDHLDSNEPLWYLNPSVKSKSRILSCGTRVYYPKLPNTPYVRLKVLEKSSGDTEILPDTLTLNEQDLFFTPARKVQNLRFSLQYMAYKKRLDGNLFTPDPGNISDSEKLSYKGNSSSSFFMAIPWIKEVNLRYIPSSGVRILSWEE